MSEADTLIEQLLEWAEHTGGWEAPIWHAASAYLARKRGEQPARKRMFQVFVEGKNGGTFYGTDDEAQRLEQSSGYSLLPAAEVLRRARERPRNDGTGRTECADCGSIMGQEPHTMECAQS